MALVELKQDTTETKKLRAAISPKNVLYATDFSPPSEAALPYACAIARHFGSILHIAHVVSDANILLMTGGIDYVSIGTLYVKANTEAQAKIDNITSRLGNIRCRSHVRHGQVWTNLSDVVTANGIDLIVLGTHGRTGFGKVVLGSVAEDILRHSPCPVLTVGPKVRGRARLPEIHSGREIAPLELELQHILLATNLTPDAVKEAPVAIGLAEEFGSRVTLMHVIEDYAGLEERPGPIERGTANLQALVPKQASLAYAPETVLEFGFAWECIVKVAIEKEADLIVLGAHARQGTSHVPWSTVHRVVAHANCPVLTVPAS